MELTQEQKFEHAFQELIKDEMEFKSQWDSKIYFAHPTVSPMIRNSKFLSAKGKDKLTTLVNRFIQKRL